MGTHPRGLGGTRDGPGAAPQRLERWRGQRHRGIPAGERDEAQSSASPVASLDAGKENQEAWKLKNVSVTESIRVIDSADEMNVRNEMQRQDVIEKLKSMGEMIKNVRDVEAEFCPKDNARSDTMSSLGSDTSIAGKCRTSSSTCWLESRSSFCGAVES